MLDYTPESLTNSQLYAAAYTMDREGGGFASAVATAFFRADGDNQKRLLYAFGNLFERYAPTEESTKGESK